MNTIKLKTGFETIILVTFEPDDKARGGRFDFEVVAITGWGRSIAREDQRHGWIELDAGLKLHAFGHHRVFGPIPPAIFVLERDSKSGIFGLEHCDPSGGSLISHYAHRDPLLAACELIPGAIRRNSDARNIAPLCVKRNLRPIWNPHPPLPR